MESIELLFEEKDIEVLDRMLEFISEHQGIHLQRKDFIIYFKKAEFGVSEKIFPKEITEIEFERYIYLLNYYGCAEMEKRGTSDGDLYTVKGNGKTAYFLKNGGFRILYDDLKRKEKIRRDKENLEFEYYDWNGKLGKWLVKTRFITIISLLISIISLIIAYKALKK